MSYGGFEYGNNFGNYGVGGGFGGGGFDPMGGGGFDSFGGGGGFMDERGVTKSPEKKTSKDRQSIIPVTIKQFNQATFENDVFQVDGVDIHVVKIIGFVESLEEHSTNLNYIIRDGTGAVECKEWVEKNRTDKSKHDKIKLNSYVKIYGNPRDYEGRRHLLVYDITVLEDWNEISYHSLDCILIHLQHTKGPLPSTSVQTLNSKVPSTPSWQQQKDSFGRNGTPNVSSLNINNKPVSNEKTSLKSIVLEIFSRGDASTGGFSIQEVYELLRRQGANVTERELKNIVVQLTDEAAIYSSISDEHFLTL
mmetsp:Transcript_9372/g.8377  ORF Transcript_9372/g.8377 Transcript_9372/m.8377 type:complete len:307 (-) Transcript_9372:122-1042(-)